MSMSRKDFQAIADAVADTKRWLDDDDTAGHAALASVTRHLAGACARRYRGGYGSTAPASLTPAATRRTDRHEPVGDSEWQP